MSTEKKIVWGLVVAVLMATVSGRDAAVVVLVLAAIIACAVLIRWAIRSRSSLSFSGPGTLIVPYSPEDAVDYATAYMARKGFAIAHTSKATATFMRPKKPKLDTGILLLLLGIIPGLLYFGLFRGTRTTSMTALGGAEGTEVVLSGDDYGGRQTLARWAKDNPP